MPIFTRRSSTKIHLNLTLPFLVVSCDSFVTGLLIIQTILYFPYAYVLASVLKLVVDNTLGIFFGLHGSFKYVDISCFQINFKFLFAITKYMFYTLHFLFLLQCLMVQMHRGRPPQPTSEW